MLRGCRAGARQQATVSTATGVVPAVAPELQPASQHEHKRNTMGGVLVCQACRPGEGRCADVPRSRVGALAGTPAGGSAHRSARYAAMMKSCSTMKAVFLLCMMNLWRKGRVGVWLVERVGGWGDTGKWRAQRGRAGKQRCMTADLEQPTDSAR